MENGEEGWSGGRREGGWEWVGREEESPLYSHCIPIGRKGGVINLHSPFSLPRHRRQPSSATEGINVWGPLHKRNLYMEAPHKEST